MPSLSVIKILGNFALRVQMHGTFYQVPYFDKMHKIIQFLRPQTLFCISNALYFGRRRFQGGCGFIFMYLLGELFK